MTEPVVTLAKVTYKTPTAPGKWGASLNGTSGWITANHSEAIVFEGTSSSPAVSSIYWREGTSGATQGPVALTPTPAPPHTVVPGDYPA